MINYYCNYYFVDVLLSRGIYYISVCPGRGIPHIWLSLTFLRFFSLCEYGLHK